MNNTPTAPLRWFFIRHGQTAFNANNIVQGCGIDSDLDEIGIEQARKFYLHHQHINFQAIYCTGLKRTHQTVAPFRVQYPEFQLLPELNELNWGQLEGLPHTPEVMHQFAHVQHQWSIGNWGAHVPGGESAAAGWERASKALTQIYNNHTGGNILICSHGRMLKIILSQLLGYGLNKMNWFSQPNTGLNILRVTTFSDSTQLFTAEKLADITHLLS